jgi:formamidopyrimidine-DNA glycosylase
MPELPEVEVTRLSFVERIAGAAILAVRLGKPLRWPLGCPPESLVGKSVVTVRRRGKYLLVDFDRGLLILHLGMSGSLRFESQLAIADSHDHFDLVTSHGTLRLHDPRRFGAVVYAESDRDPMAIRLLGRLGVEPLSEGFNLKAFQAALKGRRAPIKQALLAGELVVGVGNIYASEALFAAGIRPTTRASLLSRPRVERLHRAIRDVLSRAILAGGSTLRDFTSANGENGHFQLEAMVYGRAGEPCRRCATAIKVIRQGQRSTFYCPVCQKS